MATLPQTPEQKTPTRPPPPPPPPPFLSQSSQSLPPPPDFPRMSETAPVQWNEREPEEVSDVAWLRPATETSPPSASVTSLAEGEEALSEGIENDIPPSGFFAKLLHKLKPKKKETKNVAVQSKPVMVKAKEMICKLPDPTLVFVLQASLMLMLYVLRPYWLQTWPARIIFPLCLVPTVMATTLWRATKMVSLKAVPDYYSCAKPIPNAGKVVSIGENLRARETKLIAREQELRRAQMRLEVLRKEIEGRLPPQVSIANLLHREQHMSQN